MVEKLIKKVTLACKRHGLADNCYYNCIVSYNQEPDSGAWFAEADYCKEGEYYFKVLGSGINAECYTTVGDFIVTGLRSFLLPPPSSRAELCASTRFRYLDVYNWQPEQDWSFTVNSPLLPFSVTIRGDDKLWEDLGKVFITTGEFEITQEGGE